MMSCETLATESLFNPVLLPANKTFPGAAASFKLDVMIATMRVLMRLWLKSLDCTTTIGRRKPGPEPLGSDSEAHQISPRFASTLTPGQ